jgi:hypothetical protein
MSTVQEAIAAAKDRLKAAEFGLHDLKNDPRRLRSGLMNAVVFGRMVTFSLQNARNQCEAFDTWYEPRQLEMKSDPLLRYFSELRTKIEKQTALPLSSGAKIYSFGPETMQRLQPAPPNAEAFFIGDENGGSGWLIRMVDGKKEKYYIDLPSDIGEASVFLADLPHPLGNAPVGELLERYLNYMANLIADAERNLSSSG